MLLIYQKAGNIKKKGGEGGMDGTVCQLAVGEWISACGFIHHRPLSDFQKGA